MDPTSPASRDLVDSRLILSSVGMPVNATRSAVASHITAEKDMNWWESQPLTVRLMGLGPLKNCRLVFVSKRHSFGKSHH